MSHWSERLQHETGSARSGNTAVMERPTPNAQHPTPNATALVEKAGAQWEYLFTRPRHWSAEEWRIRLEVLSETIDRAHAAVTATGLSLEECGWSCTPGGDWHRVGEEPKRTADPLLTLISETLDQAGALLVGVDGSGPEWEPVEAEISEAYAARDEAALQTACDAYLEFAAAVFDRKGIGDGGHYGDDRTGETVRDLPDAGIDQPSGVATAPVPGSGDRRGPSGADGHPGGVPGRAAPGAVASVQSRAGPDATELTWQERLRDYALRVECLELVKQLRFPRLKWCYPGEGMGTEAGGVAAWSHFIWTDGPHHALPVVMRRLRELQEERGRR